MNTVKKLIQDFETLNLRHSLISKGDTILAAVSGGPDSMALLFLLMKIRRKYDLRLEAVHLDHGMTAQSAEYVRCVRKTCADWTLPLHLKRVRVAEVARRSGLSLEEAGRVERYRFFEEVVGRRADIKIATAHTLDDQAETVLLRVIRGSGLRGLRAIVPKRRHGRAWVIRPLLATPKRELLDLLRQQKIRFCVDRTNLKGPFLRNRVRKQLIPLLAKQYNPLIAQTLSSLQAVCADAQDHLEGVASAALERSLKKPCRAGVVRLSATALRKLHPAVLREVLCLAAQAARGDLRQLGYAHIESMANLVLGGESGGQVHMPGDFRAGLEGGALVLRAGNRPIN